MISTQSFQTILVSALLLAVRSLGDDNDQRLLLHVDFGNSRAANLPATTSTPTEEENPTVICSDATFPTGTFCHFKEEFWDRGGNYPKLNGIDHFIMNFRHPSSENTTCKMTFIGARNETPAHVLYKNISCTPAVAEQTIPSVKMSNVTSVELKIFGGNAICNAYLNGTEIVDSKNEEQNEYQVVGFYYTTMTCVLSAPIVRPPEVRVVTAFLPDRIRPVND